MENQWIDWWSSDRRGSLSTQYIVYIWAGQTLYIVFFVKSTFTTGYEEREIKIIYFDHFYLKKILFARRRVKRKSVSLLNRL